jgi:hypothetical protein
MFSPDEDLLAKMINKVGQVFGIGVKDVLFHLSCLDCIGGPVKVGDCIRLWVLYYTPYSRIIL